jgi:hypothetical protein
VLLAFLFIVGGLVLIPPRFSAWRPGALFGLVIEQCAYASRNLRLDIPAHDDNWA